MRWEGQGESENVEDRRGMRPVAIGGGIVGLIVVAVALLFGVDIRGLVGNNPGGGQPGEQQAGQDDRTLHFSKTILHMTDEVWTEEFRKEGYGRYEPPTLVLFTDEVDTGCGRAPSAVGPFYCPNDRKVYLDPSFFDELEQKLGGSKADFSKAYVIAHEVGHHVQNLTGYNDRLKQFERREGNNASIRLELQADYLAGVWAYHGQKQFNFIEPGDVDAAITTARAIGDNRIMQKAGRWPSPEKFTHGSDRQRVRWFTDGLKTGDASKRKLDHFFDPNVDPLKL